MDRKIAEENTIFKCISGSKSHGTDTPESDTDIRGVMVLPKKFYLGNLSKCGQYEDKENEIVIYNVQKFFEACTKGNPTMLENMWVREQEWLHTTPAWLKILEHRDKFLSKKIKHSYSGYAFSQWKRIQTHRGWLLNKPTKRPERKDFGLPEHKSLITKDNQNAFLQLVHLFIKDRLEYCELDETIQEMLEEVDYIGIMLSDGITEDKKQFVKDATGAGDEFMHALQMEKAYSNAKKNYKSYINWKESRNPKRADLEAKYGYDTKHASHIVRLMRTANELLQGKEFQVYRDDAEELLAIKQGAWSYEQLNSWFEEQNDLSNELYKTTTLPHKPDAVFLDNLLIEIIEEHIFKD